MGTHLPYPVEQLPAFQPLKHHVDVVRRLEDLEQSDHVLELHFTQQIYLG